MANVDLLGTTVEEITVHMYDNLYNLIFIVQSLRDMNTRHWIVKSRDYSEHMKLMKYTKFCPIEALGKKERCIL